MSLSVCSCKNQSFMTSGTLIQIDGNFFEFVFEKDHLQNNYTIYGYKWEKRVV